MKKYDLPKIEIIKLNTPDIIRTSGLTDGGAKGNLDGDPIIFHSLSLDQYNK